MNRQIFDACDLAWKRSNDDEYLVANLTARALQETALGLCMLQLDLLATVELRSIQNAETLRVGRQREAGRTSVARQDPHRTTLLLSENDLERLAHFLLRTIRDGTAEVDHLDIDALDGRGRESTVVLSFPTHAPPLSANDARRRLGG